jgi:hypothetical protein
MKYTVLLGPIVTAPDTEFQTDELIELAPVDADPLLALGAIELAPEVPPAPTKGKTAKVDPEPPAA